MRFPGYSQTRQKAEDRFAWVGFRAMTGVRSPYVYPGGLLRCAPKGAVREYRLR